jgi:hypothetical protein
MIRWCPVCVFILHAPVVCDCLDSMLLLCLRMVLDMAWCLLESLCPLYLRLPAHAHDVGIENVYWWPVHTLVVLQFLSMTCWSVIYASIIIIDTELVSQALHVYIYACSFACWCWQNIYGTYTCDMHFHAITSAHSTHPISCHSDV